MNNIAEFRTNASSEERKVNEKCRVLLQFRNWRAQQRSRQRCWYAENRRRDRTSRQAMERSRHPHNLESQCFAPILHSFGIPERPDLERGTEVRLVYAPDYCDR